MKTAGILLMLMLAIPQQGLADAGVLIPRDKSQPDAAILSLEEMDVEIRIDNGDARVFVKQIFANHTNQIEEGNYVFALPTGSTISDFAVWDGTTRIPAVILERKRAEEIYNELKAQSIDPGLLEQGERGEEDARRSSAFTAKIVPIPRFGTKRLEIEYHQNIRVENLKSFFALPLHPDAYQVQKAAHLHITFELHSAQAIRDFQTSSKSISLKIEQQAAHQVRGSFDGSDVALAEDFAAGWSVDPAGANNLEVITYRNPKGEQPAPDEMSPVPAKNEPGFVEASTLIGVPTQAQGQANADLQALPSRNIVVLFDTSLSMQWEKLERSYAALEKLLRSLRPQDRFNLLLFNAQVAAFQPALLPADSGNVTKALEFVRTSHLRGGTDLGKALGAALAQSKEANSYLVLITDGGADTGIVQSGKLAAWYGAEWKKLPEQQRPRTDVFAVGDDANLALLRMLSRNNGTMESVLSTEPIDFKLDAFLSRIGRDPVQQLRFAASPSDALQMVYPLQETAYPGSIAEWVGQYQAARKKIDLTVEGRLNGAEFDVHKAVSLPVESLDHPQLPRLWASARVAALLEQIERDGETREAIDEIIALARKYKFVTPYTSFLAAPRSLLRPRVIRPGDPVLRVKTDPSIVSVLALFPFGLEKPLRFLPDEDVWQTRFLAPPDMKDGTYSVRMILRDRNGHVYREAKTFVIASTPPTVRIALDRKRVRQGETVSLKVNASQSTRTLTAELEGLEPVSLRWNQEAHANTGSFQVPADLPAGTYKLTVTAEDIAHNLGTGEVQLEVVP